MYEKVQKFLTRVAASTKATMLMYGIGIFLVAVIIFQTGMIVGAGKDSLINEQHERYPNITTPLPTAHGTSGHIVAVSFPTFLVADEDNTEKVVLIKEETLIRSLRDELIPSDLKAGDYVVVIGTPNSRGYIQANLIRVLPKN